MTRDLQQRYRRLLAWYPREHRATYQEEMLGVLLDGAGPDRTRPTRAEATSLIAGGLWTRLRSTRTWLAGEPWRDALAVAAVVTPAALLVARVDDMLETLGIDPYIGGAVPPRIGPTVWLPAVAWAIATLAVLVAPRAAAIAGCWLAVVVEAGVQGLMFWRFGAMTPVTPWLWYAALLAAIAVTAGADPRAGLRLLGRRAATVLAAIGAVLVMGLLLRTYAPDLPGWVGVTLWSPWTHLVAVLLLAACLRPLPAALSRRVLAVFASLAALVVLGEVNRQPYQFMAVPPAGNLAVDLAIPLGIVVVLWAVSAALLRRTERS